MGFTRIVVPSGRLVHGRDPSDGLGDVVHSSWAVADTKAASKLAEAVDWTSRSKVDVISLRSCYQWALWELAATMKWTPLVLCEGTTLVLVHNS